MTLKKFKSVYLGIRIINLKYEMMRFILVLLPICAVLFAFSVLSSITPLSWMDATSLLPHLPFTDQFFTVGHWISPHWAIAVPPQTPQVTARAISFISAVMLFLLCILLAFLLYCIGAILLYHQKTYALWSYKLIWGTVLFVGSALIVAPVMLSHDVFVYASYGRLLSVYHSNPYFVPPITYPQDRLFSLNDWPTATSAYGPIWLLVCTAVSFIAGNQVLWYVLIFRCLAFAAHLFNILLVDAILRRMQRTPRTTILGVYIYAWNPLVLIECCLGGHNDVFIVTLLLLGIRLSLSAEQCNDLFLRKYILPLMFFTLAILIKFTVMPVILLFILLIICKIRRAGASKYSSWYVLLRHILIIYALCSGIVLIFYSPFWIGHNSQEILHSFTLVPSSQFAENSILSAILIGKDLTRGSGWLLDTLSQRSTWNVIVILVVVYCCCIGMLHMWRKPTTLTFVQAALATLGGLLIVTPWFYPWYILWLMGLAAVCLPSATTRCGSALIAFTLVFSLSAFLTYFFSGEIALISAWEQVISKSIPKVFAYVGFACINTVMPPILTFLITMFISRRKSDIGSLPFMLY